jgi:hypothetical protein
MSVIKESHDAAASQAQGMIACGIGTAGRVPQPLEVAPLDVAGHQLCQTIIVVLVNQHDLNVSPSLGDDAGHQSIKPGDLPRVAMISENRTCDSIPTAMPRAETRPAPPITR